MQTHKNEDPMRTPSHIDQHLFCILSHAKNMAVKSEGNPALVEFWKEKYLKLQRQCQHSVA